MKRETKIGIFAVLTLAIFIWGFNFLKGKNLLASSNIYYVEYENVAGLITSNPVLVNGFQVGTVSDMYLSEDLSNIVVKLDIRKDVRVPEGTDAFIVSESVLGGKVIELDFNGLNCEAGNCAASGTYLEGKVETLLQSFVEQDALKQYIELVNQGLQESINMLSKEFNDEDSRLGQMLLKVEGTLDNLESGTQSLDRLLSGSSGDIKLTLENFAKISENLAASNAEIRMIISNVDSLTSDLADANFDETGAAANQLIENLQGTLKTADAAIVSLSDVLEKVKSGEGTIAQLVNEGDLYVRLNEMVDAFALLGHDVRVNPQRYRRILSKKTKTDPITEIPEAQQEGKN